MTRQLFRGVRCHRRFDASQDCSEAIRCATIRSARYAATRNKQEALVTFTFIITPSRSRCQVSYKQVWPHEILLPMSVCGTGTVHADEYSTVVERSPPLSLATRCKQGTRSFELYVPEPRRRRRRLKHECFICARISDRVASSGLWTRHRNRRTRRTKSELFHAARQYCGGRLGSMFKLGQRQAHLELGSQICLSVVKHAAFAIPIVGTCLVAVLVSALRLLRHTTPQSGTCST